MRPYKHTLLDESKCVLGRAYCLLGLKHTRMRTVITFIERCLAPFSHQRSMAIDGKNQDSKARRICPTEWKAPALDGTVRAQTAEPLVYYTAADKREISLRGRRKMGNG